MFLLLTAERKKCTRKIKKKKSDLDLAMLPRCVEIFDVLTQCKQNCFVVCTFNSTNIIHIHHSFTDRRYISNVLEIIQKGFDCEVNCLRNERNKKKKEKKQQTNKKMDEKRRLRKMAELIKSTGPR